MPSETLRQRVRVSACLLLLAGLTLIQYLDVSVWLRVLTAVAWVTEVGVALARLARGQSRVRCLLMRADGRWLARDKNGEQRSLELLRDSVVTQRMAWLRFGSGRRQVYTELFLRGQVEAEAWRRLQVGWRWAAGRRYAA